MKGFEFIKKFLIEAILGGSTLIANAQANQDSKEIRQAVEENRVISLEEVRESL